MGKQMANTMRLALSSHSRANVAAATVPHCRACISRSPADLNGASLKSARVKHRA